MDVFFKCTTTVYHYKLGRIETRSTSIFGLSLDGEVAGREYWTLHASHDEVEFSPSCECEIIVLSQLRLGVD